MVDIEEWVDTINNEGLGNYKAYNKIREIGRGGYSVVSLVERHGIMYAMKEPLDGSSTSIDDTYGPRQQSNEDFMREAAVWARVTKQAGDHVVRLFDYNIDPHPWMVMEVADSSFSDAMARGEVGADSVMEIMDDLRAVHSAGYIHRDIKPANILKVNGRWKLSDFGLSKGISASTGGVVRGTVEYMAPEQIQPRSQGGTDVRTDVWQTGILLYHLVVGRTPYPNVPPDAIGFSICLEGPDLESVPDEYRDILGKALSQRKEDRYQSIEDFADAVEEVISGGRTQNSQGHQSTDRNLREGLALLTGSGGRFDRRAAYDLFESGTGLSKAIAAYMKHEGIGTVKDERMAEALLSQATDNVASIAAGDAVSEWICGEFYEIGLGVEQSYDEALRHYLRSAEHSFPPAQHAIAVLYDSGSGVPQSYEEEVRWYFKAAEQGYAPSQANLASCYYMGDGVPQSYEESVRWNRKAAEQGHAGAQFNLATCYENGIGVPRSFEEAVRWYRMAGDQGDVRAQFNLATLYENGEGVPQSYEEAVRWYRLAAEQGEPFAQYSLGYLYEKGRGVFQSYEEAARWYRLAAEQGDADAQYKLGICYERGQGVSQSLEEAERWFRMSAEQGNDSAMRHLEELQSGYRRNRRRAYGSGMSIGALFPIISGVPGHLITRPIGIFHLMGRF